MTKTYIAIWREDRDSELKTISVQATDSYEVEEILHILEKHERIGSTHYFFEKFDRLDIMEVVSQDDYESAQEEYQDFIEEEQNGND